MRKRCNRRVYNLVNPIEFAMRGAAFMTNKELQNLRIRELSCLDSIVHGKGALQDWVELAECINITEVMATNGIGPESLEICRKAQEEMEEAYNRFKQTGTMGLSGVGIQAMREVLEYAALMQTSIPRSQFEKMIDKTRKLIKGRIGNQKGKHGITV
jgi:hypothetical protein